MEEHTFKAAGIYADAAHVREARERLEAAGIATERIVVLERRTPATDEKLEPEGDAVRDDAIRDLLAGAGVGGGAGALGAGAAALLEISVVVSQPALAALLAAGYGAAIGTITGGAKTLRVDEGRFVTVVKDALRAGHCAVVVHAIDAAERDLAEEVIARTAARDEASV